MSKLSNLEKEILAEFMKTQNFFFAADNICQNNNIGLSYRKDSFEIFYTEAKNKGDKKLSSKKTPEWLVKYSLGLEIIWSTVTLYRFLIDEKMIFDFNERSDYQDDYLGHPQDHDTNFLVSKDEIPELVKNSFLELMEKKVHTTKSLERYVRNKCCTVEEIKHKQILIAAWIAIFASLTTSSIGIILQLII